MAFSDTTGAAEPENMPVVRHHLERGDIATGADGASVGTVVQMVMDRATGQPSAVVIRSDVTNAEYELSWSHIVDTSGGQVRLDVSGNEFPSVAHPYNPDQYVPVETGQAVPPTQAGKIARDEGHPVVMSIQPDAVELVEPQMPTDEATRPYASLPPSNLKRTAPLIPESTAPTRPLAGKRQGAKAEQGETKTETERETLKPAPSAPPIETSPLSSTEGELIGGKPSTSGSGAASTVPTPGTERSDEGLGGSEQGPTEQMSPTSSAARPDIYMSTHPASKVSGAGVSTPPAQPSVTPVSQFSGKVQQIGASVQQRARQLATTAQESSRQVAQTAQQRTQQARQTVAERWNSPLVIRAAAAGLGTGTLIGVIVAFRRRRASPRSRLNLADKQAGLTASTVQDAASGLLEQTQASAQSMATAAQERAARASLQAKRRAKRTARRIRWFRNGLLLGSILGILFAPEPGAELRTQITNRVERWRSKTA